MACSRGVATRAETVIGRSVGGDLKAVNESVFPPLVGAATRRQSPVGLFWHRSHFTLVAISHTVPVNGQENQPVRVFRPVDMTSGTSGFPEWRSEKKLSGPPSHARRDLRRSVYFSVSSSPANGFGCSTVGSSVSSSPMPRVNTAVVTEIDVDDGE